MPTPRPGRPFSAVLALLVCSWLLFGSIDAALADASDCAPRSETIALAGGELAYLRVDAGQADAPGVLLLHGLFANKEHWSAILCPLAAAGYDVVAPDLPGFGASHGFAISDYDLDRQATLLLALTDALDLGRFHLAGNSMGGAIAALLAAASPERVESLAFVGGPLGIVDWGPGVRQRILNGDNPFIPMDDEDLDHELALLFAAPPTLPADQRDALLDEYHQRLGHYRQVWDIVNLFDTLLSDADGSPLPVDMPALILWGEDDGIYPVAGAQALAARQPRAQVLILPDTSHLPMLERPAATISALLEHLATASRGGDEAQGHQHLGAAHADR